MGLVDIVFKNAAPFVLMTLIASGLWIYGYTVSSSSITFDGWAVFIAGIVLQFVYLIVRFVF
jgi:uncharacterized membrane protein